MIPLPDIFLQTPLAHRGYHDASQRRPENSRAALEAAIDHGYGIELDVQLSADHQAMVFHDYDLARLSDGSGAIQLRTAEELRRTTLKHSDETVPTLEEVLTLVNGQVPLLIEIKDQDGQMGKNLGPLESAVARALQGYQGPVAVMSFNPNAVAAFAKDAPNTPIGLVTSAYSAEGWPLLKREVAEHLAMIPDFETLGASFISHEAADLPAQRVAELKAGGAKILCWTVRSPEAEKEARKIADNITFEGYAAALHTKG